MHQNNNFFLFFWLSQKVKNMNSKQQIKQIETEQIKKANSVNSYKYLINFSNYSNKNKYSIPYYMDTNIFSLLKSLLKLNKISKNQYKDSIKRLKTNRKLNYKVYEKLHYLLTTNKAHLTKTTIRHLKMTEHKKFITISYNDFIVNKSGLAIKNNNVYKVFIKKKAYNNLININSINIKQELSMFINNKTNKFLGGDNK
jgi:hypothetical protein